MDAEELAQILAETDDNETHESSCEEFPEKRCSEYSTLSSATLTTSSTATTPEATTSEATASDAPWNPFTYRPETASYTIVSVLTSASVISTSSEAPETPTIISTIVPAPEATSATSSVETSAAETISSNSTTTTSSHNHHTTKTVTIAVPVAVGSVAIIVALISFLLWRRRRKSNQKRSPSSEMSHEAGTAFLSRNDPDLGHMDAPLGSSSRFRDSVTPQPVPHYTPTPNTTSETRLMDTATQPLNIPTPPPPRYSTITTTRDGNQTQNNERHSALIVENLAALPGWNGAEAGEMGNEHARSPFGDLSDDASTISSISDIASPAARRHREVDEVSVVSSLGDEHGDK